MNGDLEIGTLVLAANEYWVRAALWTRACAWILGRHEHLEHLDLRLRIAWWRGKPYLLTLNEVA
jgi:hypothetical protein